MVAQLEMESPTISTGASILRSLPSIEASIFRIGAAWASPLSSTPYPFAALLLIIYYEMSVAMCGRAQL